MIAKANIGKDSSFRIVGRGSLSEFLCFWLENEKLNRVKASTYAQYYERIHTHIIPVLGQIAICRLTKEQAQDFVNRMCQKGLSASTVRNIAGLLDAAMKKAVALQLSRSNPCADLILPKMETMERRALDRAEQIRLERLLRDSGEETELGILLALYTGLRIGEICALRWSDINLQMGTLTVRGTLQRVKNLDGKGPKTVLSLGTPKSKRSFRTIPLPRGLADKLRRYGNDMSGGCYVLSGRESPLEPHTFRARFNRLAARAGLDVPFHCLRHTFATRCLEYNFDIQTVSDLLGHSTAGVTMKVYAHCVFEHKRMLTNRIHILSEYNEPSNKPSKPVLTC